MYFCAAYGCAEKEDPSKGCCNPKCKLGVTTHFSEINLERKCHTFGYPQFSFWTSIILAKIRFFSIVITYAKTVLY